MEILSTAQSVNSIAHLIELSVAPVFLIAGVAGLLNVFIGRIARIIDRLEKVDSYINNQKTQEDVKKAEEKLFQRREFLTKRMQNINLAIFFCTATGLLIAMVIVTMFLSSLFAFEDSIFIASLFIVAMLSLIISLFLFLREIYFTTSFIKSKKSLLQKKL
jgi:magnesium-transporting ATPase (P-type)